MLSSENFRLSPISDRDEPEEPPTQGQDALHLSPSQQHSLRKALKPMRKKKGTSPPDIDPFFSPKGDRKYCSFCL